MSGKRATKVQMDTLVSFIMKNRIMVNGNRMDPAVQRLWSNITDQLNAYGIQKSRREWMETYKLLARKTRVKARNIIIRTGSSEGVDDLLNSIEKKTISIEGPTSANGIQQREAGVTRVEGILDDSPTQSPPSTYVLSTSSPSSPSVPSTSTQSVPLTSENNNEQPVHHDDFEESLKKSSENLCNAIHSLGDKILEGMRLISVALMANAKQNN